MTHNRKNDIQGNRKKRVHNLDDSSTTPHTVKNKISSEVEAKVIELKDELWERYQILLSHHTIRNIVRRNKNQIRRKNIQRKRRSYRPFVNWYSSKAFEVVPVDLKQIIDQKAS